VPAETLKGAAYMTSTTTSTTTGNITTSQTTGSTGTNAAILAAASAAGLGNFMQGVSGFTIGDTSAGMTTPRAYEDLAATLSNKFSWEYCDGYLPSLVTMGCMRQGADTLFLQLAQIYQNCFAVNSNCSFIKTDDTFVPFRIIDANDDANDNGTAMPRFVFENAKGMRMARVCAGANKTILGNVDFVLGGSCDDSNSHTEAFEGTIYNDPENPSCPDAAAYKVAKDGLPAAYLMHANGLCSSDALANARALFCLLETGDAGTTDKGCSAEVFRESVHDPERFASIWSSSVRTKLHPSPTITSPLALTVPGSRTTLPSPVTENKPNGKVPVYVAYCAVRTTRQRDGQDDAQLTVVLQSWTRLSAVQLSITPMDAFNLRIDGDDSQSSFLDQIKWRKIKGSDAARLKSPGPDWVQYSATKFQQLPHTWIITPPYVKCDPTGAQYPPGKGLPPWNAATPPPSPALSNSPSEP
jgi:hypothetical protein